MSDTTVDKEQQGYVPHDREVKRDRSSRLLLSVIIGSVVFIGPALIGYKFNISVLGLGTGSVLLVFAFPYITANVPPWQGLVTTNIFSGTLVIYGTGLHPRLPWEEIHKEGNLPLSVVTREVEETIPTTDDEITARVSFQFAAKLPVLDRFSGIAASTIENGFKANIFGLLSSMVAGVDAETARKDIILLSRALMAIFGVIDTDDKDNEDEQMQTQKYLDGLSSEVYKKVMDFVRLYGVYLVLVRIEDIDFSEAFQESRSAKAAVQPVLDIFEAIKGKDTHSVERAMIIAGRAGDGGVKRISITGTAGDAVAATVAKVLEDK